MNLITYLGNNLVSLVVIKGIVRNSVATIITSLKVEFSKETPQLFQVGDLGDLIIQFSNNNNHEATMG
jgi:hypothetical protein